MSRPEKCSCGGESFEEGSTVTVSHRAFGSLGLSLEVWRCLSCGEDYVGADYDSVVDKTYARELRARVGPLVSSLNAFGIEDIDLETMLGLDAGEVERVLEGDDCSDPVTKVLASLLLTTYLLNQNPSLVAKFRKEVGG